MYVVVVAVAVVVVVSVSVVNVLVVVAVVRVDELRVVLPVGHASPQRSGQCVRAKSPWSFLSSQSDGGILEPQPTASHEPGL